MKLALGTAQFGLDYGISNKDGIVPATEVAEILKHAAASNIDTIDTGSVYGNSEEVLGDLFKQHQYQFELVDKIPDLETHKTTITQVLQQSLTKLKIDKLKGLLLHNAADLNDDSFKELTELKSQGLVEKIGVSVYSPSKTYDICNQYDIDLIQCPINLFDQRFIESGCVSWLHHKGIEIHARSLFLQGLLLMKLSQLPDYFQPYYSLFERFRNHCRGHDINQQTAALTIAHRQKQVDKFVIGVCSKQQLIEVIDNYQKAANCDFEIEEFSSHEEALISPFLWPAKN